MSLMDSIKKEKVQDQMDMSMDPTTPTTAEEESSPTAGKKSNSDYQKRARARALAAAQLIKECLKKNNVKLTDEEQDAIDVLCKEKKFVGPSNFGKSTIYKIFGNTPKVGTSVTALKVFEETGKGFSDMRKLMKKWSEQKIEVTYDEVKKVYVIKAGTIPAYVE